MEVFLIRHAHSGARTSGIRDEYRPLSEEGKQQAESLAGFFSERSVTEVHSSPATRCLQTVAPLAAAANLQVVEQTALWETANLAEVLDLIEGRMEKPSDGEQALVMCSHGNLIPAVIDHLARSGVNVVGRGCERASIWMIRTAEGRWTDARYYTPRLDYAG